MIAIDLAGVNPYGWLALLAPACMYWVLVYISAIPPLEEHMLRSRCEMFRTYQRRTRAFCSFPSHVILETGDPVEHRGRYEKGNETTSNPSHGESQ